MTPNITSPAASVIIPMYKVEDYLAECLDSVVGQTLDNIEIICVNDGSPDRSGEIAERYAREYKNVRVINQENGGLSRARNTGLDAARGRYVYFLDSDDYLDREALEGLYRKAEADQLDIVYFNTVSFFENEAVKNSNQNYLSYYNRKGDYSGVHTGQMMFAKMRKNLEFFGSACLQMIRRSLIEENGLRFYNDIIHEDNLFSFKAAMLAQRVGYLNKAYYYRRVHGDSIVTAGKSMRNVEGYIVSYAEMIAFLHEREVEEAAASQIFEYLYHGIFRNAANILRSLDLPEEEAGLTKGDYTAAHFLDLIKRNEKIERERDRLKVENQKLRNRITVLEKNLHSPGMYRLKRTVTYIPRKIVGGINCIRENGFAYTVRRAFWKLGNKLSRMDAKLSRFKLYGLLSWLPRMIFRCVRAVVKHGPGYPFRALYVKCLQKFGGKNPLVSVIMPVYNVEAYIEQGLDTLLRQTMRHIEIICVDDGSTDRSLEILNRYAAQDSRVRVFTQQNKYAGVARNLGLANAKGEYVIFLDSDDFFAKSLTMDAYYSAKVNKADVVLFGAKHYNNATGKYKEAKWLLNAFLAPKKQPFSYRDCPENLYRITTPCPWTKMFRREFVQKAGLQFQHLQNSNDLFFTYAALAMAERIAVVDKALVYYRVGMETNLQATKKKNPFCFYEAYQAWHDKLVELGVMEELRRSYVNIALSGCLYNLRSIKDMETKKVVFDRFKNEIMDRLELCGHQAHYYHTNENYRDLLLIQNSSFEEYLAAHE